MYQQPSNPPPYPSHGSSSSDNEMGHIENMFKQMMEKNANSNAHLASHNTSIFNLEVQMGQISQVLNSHPKGALRSDTVVNPKGGNNTGHAMVVITRSGRDGNAPTSNKRLLVDDDQVIQEEEITKNVVQVNEEIRIDIDDSIEETQEEVNPSRDHIIDIPEPVDSTMAVLQKRKKDIGWTLIMPFGLCNAPATFQQCMMAIFTNMVENYLEVFMDDFSVVGDSFDDYLANLNKVMARCEETNLLLKKYAKFNFNDDCMRAFELLKLKLTTTLIITTPNWSLPFELMCDASDVAVGTVLGQRINKIFYPVYYASKTMNSAQGNYTVIEKELLAIVFAIEKFRSYLMGAKFSVHIDHVAL
ncbi:uncharacterized protein [Nicotiana tomentosiformis]|uniref:uncharacterized protein n=1 Tax=Nicotiana tomentosiformis TaxID=4098 RepID=UPI00388C8B87